MALIQFPCNPDKSYSWTWEMVLLQMCLWCFGMKWDRHSGQLSLNQTLGRYE